MGLARRRWKPTRRSSRNRDRRLLFRRRCEILFSMHRWYIQILTTWLICALWQNVAFGQAADPDPDVAPPWVAAPVATSAATATPAPIAIVLPVAAPARSPFARVAPVTTGT